MNNNMVKEEMGDCHTSVVKSGHCFGPFGEVVYCNNDVLMVISRGGRHSMKSMPHLHNGIVVMARCSEVGGA